MNPIPLKIEWVYNAVPDWELLEPGVLYPFICYEKFIGAGLACPKPGCGKPLFIQFQDTYDGAEHHGVIFHGKLSVVGSIQSPHDCGAHFWIEDNQVIWQKDTDVTQAGHLIYT